ncbi:MAG: ABC transporter permease [Candidatus Solibacter usitatus]|nr:ABC transporter permease [Candidatus Solibacter usitatus]
MLSKNPGFTAIAVATMAIGIGVNTAIFSVVDALLWKPLPFPDLERLVMLHETDARRAGNDRNTISPSNFLDWKAQVTTLDSLGAVQMQPVNLAGEGEPERVGGCRTSPEMFAALGVSPAMGRTFRPEENEEGSRYVAVLTHGLWMRRFGGDPAILGKTILIGGAGHAVIGVMPPGFVFPMAVDLWTPLALTPQEKSRRGDHFLQGVARLKPGASLSEARAELGAIAARLSAQYPQSNAGRGARLAPLRETIQDEMTRQYSLMILAAVGFVLLIACANVANLRYVHAAGRHREIAVRAAIGASRWRVIRMMLVESFILALAGAGLGLLIGLWGMDLNKSYMPPEVARFIAGWNTIALDGRVLAFTLAVAVLSGLLSGVLPALQFSRPDLNQELKEGGRGATAGRARHRLRDTLVVAEISLALVLMVGAGLLVKGFRALASMSGQMQPRTLLTLGVSLVEAKYKERPQLDGFVSGTLERLQALPGVETAAVVTSVPFGQSRSSNSFSIEGKEPLPPGVFRLAQMQSISPDFLRVLRIPLRAGREFDARDGAETPPAAIVSEALARRCFPGEDPLGQRVRVGPAGSWWRIVGVAGDVRHDDFDRESFPVLYRPYSQIATRHADFVLRTSGAPERFMAAARAQISAVDRNQPVAIKPMEQLISEERLGLAYVAVLMAVMGIIALLLAAVGVYGVMAYSVAERTHEIGIRMALGAVRRDVLAMVVGAGLRLASSGLAIGLALAWLLARALAGLIFGVSATDLATFGGVSMFLVAVALSACYLPARRAAGVDPMVALRHE